MNHSILDRYAHTDSNAVIIDVATDKVEDLYNNFDRNSPYIRKDLNEDLKEYLVEAVSEIGKEEFVIRFVFSSPADSELVSRVRASIANYFQYMKALEMRKLGRKIQTSSIYLLTGLVMLSLSIIVNRQTLETDSVVIHVLAQGLTIAAWVSLWEAIANFLINWKPHQKMRDIYDRISRAELIFDQPTDTR